MTVGATRVHAVTFGGIDLPVESIDLVAIPEPYGPWVPAEGTLTMTWGSGGTFEMTLTPAASRRLEYLLRGRCAPPWKPAHARRYPRRARR